jgi:hypothetical protein
LARAQKAGKERAGIFGFGDNERLNEVARAGLA